MQIDAIQLKCLTLGKKDRPSSEIYTCTVINQAIDSQALVCFLAKDFACRYN